MGGAGVIVTTPQVGARLPEIKRMIGLLEGLLSLERAGNCIPQLLSLNHRSLGEINVENLDCREPSGGVWLENVETHVLVKKMAILFWIFGRSKDRWGRPYLGS